MLPSLRQIDHEYLMGSAGEILDTSRSVEPITSRSNKNHPLYDVRARFSAKYRRASGTECRLSASSPFLPKTSTEDCLKCLMKIPHKKCESHKYIRVGGGYRHGYWYIKCLLEEIELQKQRELIRQNRLEAIKEHKVKAIKTYIRTKSGRLVERIIFLSEEDYEAFKSGKDVKNLLSKYLSKDEAAGLQSWDKDEVKAIKTLVRTKSGRIIEKMVYVSKDDYEAIKEGKKDAKDILKKYVKTQDGETIEGWDEAKMKTIKTFVRTKSGRVIEKTIMISQEDYDAMIKDGHDPSDILKKYLPLEDGEQLESWQSAEPMKAIKTTIRTKSGRLIEKTILVSAEDYDKMIKGGGDPKDILKKYMNEEDGEVTSWEKAPDGKPMKVVKTTIRTKSGRLIEKTIMMTEDEYKEFQESGGNPDFLKKFITLEKGEEIEDWEKASTVYSAASDDIEFKKAKAGQRIVGKDGAVYEVVVDPLTGKKYKKKIGQNESDVDSGIASMRRGKGRKKKGGGAGGLDEYEEETPKERARRKAGKRDEDSDSEYSYKSYKSDGGTRHVTRRRKKADGTYSEPESYHSDQDEEGQARRRRRRRERAHEGSAHSYYSVVSEGGTRKVRRKKKRADGTYSASESYHSSDSELEGGGLASKKKKKRREHGSDSEHSYYSEVSVGGTHHRKRKKKLKDKDGKVIGYASAESYSSDDESVYTEVSDGKGGKMRVKKENPKKGGKGGKNQGKGKGKGKRRPSSAIFSDSTESDDVDLENMTEEEKKKYFEGKAKRKEAREARRREKYGDKYDEMVTQNDKRKKEKERAKKLAESKKPKSMVSYDKGARRSVVDPIVKENGPHDGKNKKKTKDGHEADDESDEESVISAGGTHHKKKKKDKHGARPGSQESQYEYEYDDKGRVTKKKKKKGGYGDGSGSEYEYEYDEDGKVKSIKKVDKRRDSQKSDGDYFEVDEKGMIKLKAGRKKIDINRLTADALIKLGIDPNASKQEIARKLKEMFGDGLLITDNDTKIGTKHLYEYGSDVGTDELANDSDLDISDLHGTRRVNVLMRRGGQEIIDFMKKVLELSKLRDDDYYNDVDEKDGDIDFLSHYRLVDSGRLESYARAFCVEDGNRDICLSYEETRMALGGVPSIQQITTKQLEYVLKVLNINDASQITFRMFAVMTALSERVTSMDPLSKHLLEICDLLDIERKMDLYKSMFNSANTDGDSSYIKVDALRIDLIAGGLNWKQQQFVMDRLQPNWLNEISFLDYMCYIPLFMSMHDNIVDNPLDMSDNKYEAMMRKPSGSKKQRDINPLGFPLKRESSYQMRQQAKELLEGKVKMEDIRAEKRDMLQKYTKLPKLLEKEPTRKTPDSEI
ncbi:hypothetical protein LOTGIDRAFT_237314 [Lottia gigantea]|uniref:Uncharacterized protein n=1 Tax=Lottia gigantea TaxID=225164 RepID=V4BAN3_LOTGI|nr:hypothetical protein LOTGIDRAFT_237314 [Lottia gigantea]ESP04566.1 hypothetical protein LOTGIDRAFT_237314 [Lottia gigantea]